MKKQLILAAAIFVSAAIPAPAGDNGRTVCVLRARPVAIQPVYRPVAVRPRPYFAAASVPGYGSNVCYSCNPALRIPVTYGQYIQRTHYVSPCMPNGYVGGIQNLPTNVIQIPPVFGKPAFRTPAPHAGHAGHGGRGGR